MSKLSLGVKDKNVSETEKIIERQQIVSQFVVGDHRDLFSYLFNPEKVGQKNCENLVGSIELPVGLAGPVSVEGDIFNKNEELLLPLATTEGALVASTNRGCKAIFESGGARVIVSKIGMSRAPVFECRDGQRALQFVEWLKRHEQNLVKLAESTSSHLTYLSHHSWIRGRKVFVRFVFDTEEAMGMNMVTIALRRALDELLPNFKGVELISLSSNVCADKKDSSINMVFGRGYWVQVEAFLSPEVLRKTLKVNAQTLVKTHIDKNLVGSNVAGSRSQNMQAANVIAAMFAATGQDIAHVVEGAQAFTTFERDRAGVYAAVTLPNVNVGVVGGGTGLVAQTQARKMIRQGKNITAQQLAGVVGVGVLAAEISGLAALSSNSLARAHQKLGREE